MNDLKIFENHQFGEIRVIEQDGEPWFVAADVCRALELEDTGRATARLDEDELTRIKIVSDGQNRAVLAVSGCRKFPHSLFALLRPLWRVLGGGGVRIPGRGWW